MPARYDDVGSSGGSLERPALQRQLAEVRARRVDVIGVYKVDRLTRALPDIAKRVELFDGHGLSLVSVTRAFNMRLHRVAIRVVQVESRAGPSAAHRDREQHRIPGHPHLQSDHRVGHSANLAVNRRQSYAGSKASEPFSSAHVYGCPPCQMCSTVPPAASQRMRKAS